MQHGFSVANPKKPTSSFAKTWMFAFHGIGKRFAKELTL